MPRSGLVQICVLAGVVGAFALYRLQVPIDRPCLALALILGAGIAPWGFLAARGLVCPLPLGVVVLELVSLVALVLRPRELWAYAIAGAAVAWLAIRSAVRPAQGPPAGGARYLPVGVALVAVLIVAAFRSPLGLPESAMISFIEVQPSMHQR
jgi:hypothetical protein